MAKSSGTTMRDRTEDHRDEQDRVVVHARGLARRDD